jgi:L-ribulose-5-phosphate 3-epimerase
VMKPISCMSASFVAREVSYRMRNWQHGDEATNAYFSPIATFAARLDELLTSIRAMGFDAVDLWTAHLNPAWATREHIRIALDLLERYEIVAVSLAGGFGNTAEEFEASCQLAAALDVGILGGGAGLLAQNRARVAELLREYGLR